MEQALAILVLTVHLAWIGLVILGALWTRRRPVWSLLHVASLVWGIAVELGPWSCPLTIAEEHFETMAGMSAYQGSFILHYLDAIVYPNLPGWMVAGSGVAVCAVNLVVYGRRGWNAIKRTEP